MSVSVYVVVSVFLSVCLLYFFCLSLSLLCLYLFLSSFLSFCPFPFCLILLFVSVYLLSFFYIKFSLSFALSLIWHAVTNTDGRYLNSIEYHLLVFLLERMEQWEFTQKNATILYKGERVRKIIPLFQFSFSSKKTIGYFHSWKKTSNTTKNSRETM